MTTSEPQAPEPIGLHALAAIEDEGLRTGVVELFEFAQSRVDDGAVDVLVLSARRLVCLYQLLIENGFPPLRGCTVVTSHFRDQPVDGAWRNVLILDDSVVLGTTLFELFGAVRERAEPTADISCVAVCVDVDQRADYLLEAVNFHPLHERSRVEVEKFSEQVVQVLYQGSVPYFGDFPVTKSWDTAVADWRAYLESEAWWVADVTAPLIAESNQASYTQVPKDATVAAFVSRLPSSVGRLVEAFKIRSFVRTSEDGWCSVRQVPIAMLAPAHPSDLDVATKDLGLVPSVWGGMTAAGKHRFLQSLVSAMALTAAIESEPGKSIGGRSTEDVLDAATLALHFSAEHTELIYAAVARFRDSEPLPEPVPVVDRTVRPVPSQLLDDEHLVDVLWDERELLSVTGLPAQPSLGELTKVGLIFLHAISAVFGYVSSTLEVSQRRHIAALGNIDAYLAEFGADPTARVLNHCLTLRELMVTLAPGQLSGSLWARSIVSLGIDAGNDLGIVVPTIVHDVVRDVVYRCYRLGETAPLADRPLPAAAWDGVWDTLTLAAVDGYPLRSLIRNIDDDRDQTSEPRSSVDSLRAAVVEAIPGRAIARYEGVVVNIENDTTFDATLSVPASDTERFARLQNHQLSSEWVDGLQTGMEFFWTVFETDRTPNARDRVSRISVKPPERLDLEALERGAKQLADLVD